MERARAWRAVLAVCLLAAAVRFAAASEAAAAAGDGAGRIPSAAALLQLVARYPTEVGIVLFLVLYALAILAGRQDNAKHAEEWSRTFAAPEDSLLAQQFSHHGYVGLDSRDAHSFYWREGPDTFKFWASGRRFCQGMLFTLRTPPRHDLFKRFLPGSGDGTLEVEAWFAEGSVAPMVFAVAPPKALKRLARTNEDIKDFCKQVDPSKASMPLWPSSGGGGARELGAIAETAALFGDAFGDARVQQLVGRDPMVAKHLRAILCSTEGSLGKPGRLKLTFSLPPPGRAEELRPCLTLALLLLDSAGAFKPSADAAAKAAALRQKVAAARAAAVEGDPHEARRRADQERRAARMQEERERAARQGPAALQKFEDRVRKAEIQKQMKKRSVRA